MKAQLRRARRLSRKPPRYLARRAADELLREAQRVQLETARRGRGRLAADHVLGDAELALEATAGNARTLAPWATAAAAVACDERLRSRVRLRTDAAKARRIELFGDAPADVGRPPMWNRDVHSGFDWARSYHRRIDYRNRHRPSDVKVAWELSRMRHCVALAQGAAVLGDADSVAEVEADLASWRAANPLGWSVNWTCAMEVALRAVNLICTDAILVAAGRPLAHRKELVASLYQHGWFLARNLEISDLNGNHFLADAVGLVWLGRWFAGIGEAEAWTDRGLEMVLDAASNQILADGIDHEGSLPYHVLVLELFCVARAAAGPRLQDIDPTLDRMLDAGLTFAGPDGQVPDIGDDDGGRALAFSDAPSRDARRVLGLAAALLDRPVPFDEHPEDAIWLTGSGTEVTIESRPSARPRVFEAAGLVVLGGGSDEVVWDIGPIGFRGLGGHGHVDAMSLEARLGGIIAVRDSGTGSYTGDPELRNELRDGPAHSLATIDGRSYAEIGDADQLWHIAENSPPRLEESGTNAEGQYAAAVQRLPRGAEHRRRLHWSPGKLEIADEIRAPVGARVDVRLQVPHDCGASGEGFATSSHVYRVHPPPGAGVSTEACRVSERYGSVTTGERIVVTWVASGEPEQLRWAIEAVR